LLRLELLGGGSCGPGGGVAVDPARAPLDAGALVEPGRLPSSMSRRLLPTAVLAVVLHASVVRADDVYAWTDASGETHYTNDIASIPEKARRTLRKLSGVPEPVAPPSALPGVVELDKPKPTEPEPAADTTKQPAPEQPPAPQPIEEAIQPPRDDE